MENSIIDIVIRIQNGYLAGRESITSPYSKFKEEVLKKLLDLKFIKKYVVSGEKVKLINIDLDYSEGKPALTGTKILSRPGQRVYVSYKELKPVLSGIGYALISTSKGLMTNKEARKAKLGGELLFHIW